MRHPVNIPALCPLPAGNPDSFSNYVASQPIMQLKELTVKQPRYDQWKHSLRRSKWKKGADTLMGGAKSKKEQK